MSRTTDDATPGKDRALLIQYLQYAVNEVATLNPTSALLIEMAIDNLHVEQAAIEARTTVN